MTTNELVKSPLCYNECTMWQKIAAVGIAVIGFNIFLFGHPIADFGTLGFLATIAWIHAWLSMAFFTPKQTNKQTLALASAGIAIFTAAMSVVRANQVDTTLLGLSSVAFTTITLYLFALQHHSFGALSEIIVVPLQVGFGWLFTAIQTATQFPTVVRHFLARFHFSRRTQLSFAYSSTALRTLLITVPLVLVIGALLSSADPVFSKLVGQFFTFKLPHFAISIPVRLTQTIVLIAAVIPFIALKISDRFVSPLQKKHFGNYRVEATVAVAAVAVLIGFFLVVQFRYLFSTVPETQLHQFGINTYSEYVRKGFSELLLVACIIYAVVGASMMVLRQIVDTRLRNLNLALLGESLIFIISIFRRVLLYQAEHGLTRIRIYGSFFLVLLIALTVVLILRHLVKTWHNWYQYELGIMVATLLLTSFCNVDRMIATHFPPTVNQEIDYVYISRLSADGAEGWLAATNHAQEVMQSLPDEPQAVSDDQARQITYAYQAVGNVYGNYFYLVRHYGTKDEKTAFDVQGLPNFTWFSANAGELGAYQLLREKLSPTELFTLKAQTQRWYDQLTDEQRYKAYDRSAASPLL